MSRANGTEGYAENAAALIQSWKRLSFFDKPRPVLELMPTEPSRILDVGAGIGVDAAALAAMGHRVVAVEPTDAFRLAGTALFASTQIEWIADALPDFGALRRRAGGFDLVLLSAVWMHLDALERRRAMRVVASLIRPAGRMIMSLRHGPAPEGRRMFEVTADETVQLAKQHDLQPLLRLEASSVQEGNRIAGVTWTHLGFVKGGEQR